MLAVNKEAHRKKKTGMTENIDIKMIYESLEIKYVFNT